MTDHESSAFKYRVLVVDDNVADLTLFREAIAETRVPIILTGCSSAVEAIDLLSLNNDFDLILSDLNMPQVSGLELFKRLHGKPEFKAIPLVLMSSSERNKLPPRLANELDVPYFTKADTWAGFMKLAKEIYAMLQLGKTASSGQWLAERMTPPVGYPKFTDVQAPSEPA